MGGTFGTLVKKTNIDLTPRFICIEGNIAAGKSTCLERLRSMNYTVYTEPIDTSWAPLFALRNQDPKRWSFTFQVRVLCTLHRQISQARALSGPFKGNVIFFERSPKAALAFAKVGHLSGHLNYTELSLLKEMYDEMHTNPDMYLYLDAPVKKCLARIKTRNRPGETALTENDLNTLSAAMQTEDLATTKIDASGPANTVVANVLQAVLSIEDRNS